MTFKFLNIGPITNLETFIGGAIISLDEANLIAQGQVVYHLSDIMNMTHLHKSTRHFFEKFKQLVEVNSGQEYHFRNVSYGSCPSNTFEFSSSSFENHIIVLSLCLYLPFYTCFHAYMGGGERPRLSNKAENSLIQVSNEIKSIVLKSYGAAYDQLLLNQLNKNVVFGNELIKINPSRIGDLCFDTYFVDHAISDL